MFKYVMAFFAVLAIAFAVPNPEARPNPNPKPLVASVYSAPYAYSAGVPLAYAAPAVYSAGVVPAAYTVY